MLGHATSGPALQQNLVCVMEGRAADGQAAGSRHRRRPDPPPRQARGRLDRRACAARRSTARSPTPNIELRRHRRDRGRQGARPVRGRDDARAVPRRVARRGRQAAAPRAHRRLGRRLDRDRGLLAGAGRRAQAGADVAFEKQSESNAMWALSVPVPFNMPVHAGAGGYFAPHVRSYIRRSEAPTHIGAIVAAKDRQNALKNPYAHLQQQGHHRRVGARLADALGPDPLRRDLPVLRRRVRARDRRRGHREGLAQPGLDPRHRDALGGDHGRRARPGQPAGLPRRGRRHLQAGRHHQPDRGDRRGRDLRAVLLVRADVAGEPRLRAPRARAGSSPSRAPPRWTARCRST